VETAVKGELPDDDYDDDDDDDDRQSYVLSCSLRHCLMNKQIKTHTHAHAGK